MKKTKSLILSAVVSLSMLIPSVRSLASVSQPSSVPAVNASVPSSNSSKPESSSVPAASNTASGVSSNSSQAAENTETVAIVAINDFHGSLTEEVKGKNPGLAKVAGAITELRSEYPNLHFVSAGDQYQGSAISNLTKGESVNEALELMGMEASAIGNHEYDWGVQYMEKWSQDGNFRFLASNIVYTNDGNPVEYADPYMIKEYTLSDGKKVKVGYIGIATPETKDKTLAENVKDITFTDPAEAANKWAKHLREEEKVNAVVALTHLGGFQDKNTGAITDDVADFANKVSGIDLIFSGHTHQTIDGTVNGIQILQGYYNGRSLSVGELKFSKETGALVAVDGKVDEIFTRKDTIKPDPAVEAKVKEYEEKLKPILGEVIGKDEKGLEHSREMDAQLTPLGVWSAERLAEIGGTQVGYINGGGIRTSIEPGDITMGNMYEIFPFDNTLVTMNLSGSDLKKILQHGITHDGFSAGQYYGVNVTLDASNMITGVTLTDGTPVEDDKLYSVSTLDFLYTGGDKYDFKGGKDVVDTFLPVRDLLADYIRKNGGLYPNGIAPSGSSVPSSSTPSSNTH